MLSSYDCQWKLCNNPEAVFKKLLRSTGIDSKESIPPAYVSWRTGTINLFLFSSFAPIDCYKIQALCSSPHILSRHFLTDYGGKIDSWNWAGSMYGVEPTMSHKMQIFKAGIDFASPWRQLPYCLNVRNVFINRGALPLPHTPNMKMAIVIPSHGIDAAKNQFHNTIYFSVGIDSAWDPQKFEKFRLWILTEWNGQKMKHCCMKCMKIGQTSLT